VSGVLALMQQPRAVGGVFNIGSDEPVSILELAQRVVAAAGTGAAIQFQSYSEAYDDDFEDVRRRVPDLTRVRETIGYRPHYSLNAIIAELIDQKRKGDSHQI
jgi:UDP-glucose 4-epimerase